MNSRMEEGVVYAQFLVIRCWDSGWIGCPIGCCPESEQRNRRPESRWDQLELQPANPQRPPGINHFGLHVENMAAATAMFKQRGANLTETRVSPTKAILSNITDLNGVRIELAELPPESLHRQAMERWK